MEMKKQTRILLTLVFGILLCIIVCILIKTNLPDAVQTSEEQPQLVGIGGVLDPSDIIYIEGAFCEEKEWTLMPTRPIAKFTILVYGTGIDTQAECYAGR